MEKRNSPETIVLFGVLMAFMLLGIFAFVKDASRPKVESNKAVNLSYTSIVRLVGERGTYCSGVVIDKTTILTAAHCIIQYNEFGGSRVNPNPIEIRGADNKPLGVKAKAKVAFSQLDRGVLKGDFSLFATSSYISDVTRSIAQRIPGNKLILCGYPLGGALFCTRGYYLRDYGFFMVVKGVLIPGMSGGPTMLEDGTVIGTNTAVESDFSLISPIYNVDMFK